MLLPGPELPQRVKAATGNRGKMYNRAAAVTVRLGSLQGTEVQPLAGSVPGCREGRGCSPAPLQTASLRGLRSRGKAAAVQC